ncbi:radical SAM protein [Pseudodesulfovibrio piezophilus]|uniref:Uncharacterized protein n=1 Tax=Pseudodesulfovibrio piezophilus (strain DSM 21447 / JCM 15486 / C1TLV30) TaxID=1322246 RepID=M1WT72_PSEP2|nr:radical SAM protein [Pseudodesulfovibrio piezophilus]CCH49317.1 protein of unknown function [Pseudodesulfovibrio piezophilus C1TLV30]
MKKYFIDDNTCTAYKLILSRVASYYDANGWQLVRSAADADLAIAGCCAAFHSLEEEALNIARSVVNEGAGETVLFGCLTTVSPEQAKALGVDHVIASPQWKRLTDFVTNPVVELDAIPPSTEFRLQEEYRIYDPGKQFVLLQTGCSSDCPHCPHKLGIGPLKSVPMQTLLDQCETLVKNGAHTIVLTGNDTGSWGTDTGEGTYVELLRAILDFPVKLHLAQINPDWVALYSEALLDLLTDDRIKDFQTLIQTTSPRLLEIMNRAPVVLELEDFFLRLRELRPDIFLRTDLIIGYPTSTEEEDRATVAFTARFFDEVAVHAYERFPHTRIETMGLPFHSREVIVGRVDEAVNTLEKSGTILVHRGGQVYETMVAIEQPKKTIQTDRERSPGQQ